MRADAICLKRERATAALPAPSSRAQALAVYERQQRLVEDELRGLVALDAPTGGRAALAGLVAQIRAELDASDRLRTASLSGDSESAQGAYAQGREAARRAHAYADRLGLIVCGRA